MGFLLTKIKPEDSSPEQNRQYWKTKSAKPDLPLKKKEGKKKGIKKRKNEGKKKNLGLENEKE